jgi:hypothetical protein
MFDSLSRHSPYWSQHCGIGGGVVCPAPRPAENKKGTDVYINKTNIFFFYIRVFSVKLAGFPGLWGNFCLKIHAYTST